MSISPTRRASAITIALAVGATVVAATAAPTAEAAGTTLSGTISWTRTVTTAVDVPGGDAKSGTETTQVTMKVRMTKRSGAASFQMEDNGSSYSGSYKLASQAQERDGAGTVNCVVTHAASASASGKLPKKPTSTSAPVLFSTILPARGSLGSGTKGIVLTPVLRYKGSDTTTYAGAGISPCDPGQDVDSIDGSLLPTNDARQVCYPSGTSKAIGTPTANDVVGAWNNKKKAFVFDCATTYQDGAGATVNVKVTGALKLT